MVECDVLHDEGYHFRLWKPEGLPMTQFNADALTIPEDQATDISVKAVWDKSQMLPPHGARIWIFKARIDRHNEEVTIHMDDRATWAPVTEGKETDHLRVVEMFSGGFAGWAMAWKTLQPAMTRTMESLAIDNDVQACRTYAITHKATFLPEEAQLTTDVFATKGHALIWNANVERPELCAQITRINPEIVTISAPCPAWSGANKKNASTGLDKEEGRLMLRAILMCRTWRPKVIALEQVANFNTHVHKPMIMKAIQMMGYRVLGQKVLNADRHCQTSRCRWLALLVRITDGTTHPTVPWPTTPRPMPSPVMMLRLEDLHLLVLDARIIAVASNPKLHSTGRRMSEEQVLQSRMYDKTQTLPCFLAQYGNQHNLPMHTLEQAGYYGHFLAATAEEPSRFWHPAEVAILHGTMEQFWVDADLPTSWRITGNCIATPHAMYLLVNALRYVDQPLDMNQVFQDFHDKKLVAENCMLINTSQGQLLISNQDERSPEVMRRIMDLFAVPSDPQHMHWDYDKGWVNENQVNANDIQTQSEVSVPATEIQSTASMFPYKEVFFCFDSKKYQFWYTPELGDTEIETMWNGAYCTLGSSTEAAKMLGLQPYGPDPWNTPTHSIPICTEEELTIVKVKDDQPYEQQLQMLEFGQLFDQYGLVDPFQRPDALDVITLKQWSFVPVHTKLVPLTYAMMMIHVRWDWDHLTDTIIAKFQGPCEHVQTTMKFWAELLTQETLRMTGRQVQIEGNSVLFSPRSGPVACPQQQFRRGIAIQAAKALLSICRFANTTGTYPVKMKMFGRPLWEGLLPSDVTMDVIKTICQLAMHPTQAGRQFRTITNGKQIYEATIEELFLQGKHKVNLHIVGSQRGGGGESHKGAKQQQKQVMQTSLATILLEQGYPLEWTKQAVDQILWKYGLPRLQTIIAQPKGPNKLKDIMDLCNEQGLAPPKINKPATQTAVKGVPWQTQKKRREMHSVDPKDYQIIDGFFFNSDDSPIEIIQAIQLCLLSPAQAQQWIREDQLLSSDELAIIALGPVQPHPNLQSKPVTFPAVNPDNHKVLLHGTMVQLGNKHAKHKEGTPGQVTTEACTIMSVTMQKEDWSETDWQNITHNPAAFIKGVLEQDSMSKAIQSIWGKSLRNGKAPASPIQATSCQMHCTILDQHKKPILARSGFNGLYFVPKTQQGKVQGEYRIIWCEGDLPHVTGLCSRTSHALGLIKNRQGKGFGIRVEKATFADAWANIHPGTKPPELREGDKTFKVENLVFGTTKTMLDQWLVALKWDAMAFKPIGPQCWLIKSNHQPPEGIRMFNTSPVLIRQIQDRMPKQERVLLGPMPKTKNTSDPWQTGSTDPWANWQPTQSVPSQAAPAVASATTAAPRSAPGPIENRFQEQEAKLQALQNNIEKLAKQQGDGHSALTRQIQVVEKHQAEQVSQVKGALQQMQADMDKHFTRTLQQHTQSVDNKLEELKKIFLGSAKRGQPEAGDDEMQG
eukprot:Skav222579  [mRNA]  locus=scaffold1897:19899:24329:- [translate_table: standard]